MLSLEYAWDCISRKFCDFCHCQVITAGRQEAGQISDFDSYLVNIYTKFIAKPPSKIEPQNRNFEPSSHLTH